jgi:L-cysteine S-thiosulfotransferase
MLRPVSFIVSVVAVAVAVTFAVIPAAKAAGTAPDKRVCADKENPPGDPVTRGGCVAVDRTKGNCPACHLIAGAVSGNVAPPLLTMPQRFPDKARVRAQVEDASKFNPKTVMPPFGRHQILTPQEISDVVEFVMSL